MAAVKTVTITDNDDNQKDVVILSERWYNFLKKVVQIILPATASLYFGLSQIFGFPGGEEVVGTMALVVTFFGVILSVSANRYEQSDASVDGDAIVEEDPGGVKGVTLALNGDPEQLVDQQKISFKVRKRVA